MAALYPTKKYYLKHYFLERFGGEDVQKLLTAIYYTNLASYIPFYPFMWPFLRMLELSTGDLLTNRSVYDYLEEIGIQDSEFRKILRTSIDSPFYSSYGLARHWTHYLVQGKRLPALKMTKLVTKPVTETVTTTAVLKAATAVHTIIQSCSLQKQTKLNSLGIIDTL